MSQKKDEGGVEASVVDQASPCLSGSLTTPSSPDEYANMRREVMRKVAADQCKPLDLDSLHKQFATMDTQPSENYTDHKRILPLDW